MDEGLKPRQVQDLNTVISQYPHLFSNTPGRTNLISHAIQTEPTKIVKLKPYRIPEARRGGYRRREQKYARTGHHRTIQQ